jgi:hypothetical protein
MTRSHRLTRVGTVTVLLSLAAALSSCDNAGSSSPTTSSGKVAAATSVYPPIPPQAPGTPEGCLGRKSADLTAKQTERVQQAVIALTSTNGRLLELAPCPGGPIVVGLAPGQESLAHELWARYGDDVSITVGLTSYDGSPGKSPLCGVVPASDSIPTGLHFALDLPSPSIQSGSNFGGNVAISESGPGSFQMDTGQPIEAVVVVPGTRRVVGVYGEGIGGTGYVKDVTPGQSETIPVVGGTARCDGGVGSVLPPGHYQVIVQVAPETKPHSPAYLTPPVALRVI